jgi:hypothetical protein
MPTAEKDGKMIKKRVTPGGVVRLLNEMLKMDGKAVDDLISHRVNCNEALSDHPTVQVRKIGESYQVGMLGVLNGMFGVYEEGDGIIAAVYEVVCQNGHSTPDGSTIVDNCTVCGEGLILGDLQKFVVLKEKI